MNTNILNRLAAAVKEPLPTQSEKALEKTEPDPTPQSTAFIKARNANVRDRYSWHAKASYPPGVRRPAFANARLTVLQIVQQEPVPLYSDEELASLRRSETRMAELLSDMERFSSTAADRDHDAQAEETLRALMAGKQSPPHRSRAGIHAEYRAEQYARMELLKKITHEDVVPIATAILQRFMNRADALLRYTEEGDQHGCASWGLDYQPSIFWQAVAEVSGQYMPEARLPRATAFATPRTILEGIVEL